MSQPLESWGSWPWLNLAGVDIILLSLLKLATNSSTQLSHYYSVDFKLPRLKALDKTKGNDLISVYCIVTSYKWDDCCVILSF